MLDAVLSFEREFPADLPIDILFTGATEFCVAANRQTNTASLASRDAHGRRLRIECARMAHDTAAVELAGFITEDVLSGVRRLSVTADVLEQYVHRAPPLPGLRSIHVPLYECGNALVAHGRRWFAWDELDCLAQVGRYAPALECLTLELRCIDNGRHPSADDARELLARVTVLRSWDVAEMHLRGFPAQVVKDIEIPLDLRHAFTFDV